MLHALSFYHFSGAVHIDYPTYTLWQPVLGGGSRWFYKQNVPVCLCVLCIYTSVAIKYAIHPASPGIQEGVYVYTWPRLSASRSGTSTLVFRSVR